MKLIKDIQFLFSTTKFHIYFIISLLYGLFIGGIQGLFGKNVSLWDVALMTLTTGMSYMLIFVFVTHMIYFSNVGRIYISMGMNRKNVIRYWHLLVGLTAGFYAIVIGIIAALNVKQSVTEINPVILGINFNQNASTTMLFAILVGVLAILALVIGSAFIGAVATIYGGYICASLCVLVSAVAIHCVPYLFVYFEMPMMKMLTIVTLVAVIGICYIGVRLLAPKMEVAR